MEKILEPDTPIPCKIDLPHTYIGEESVKHLKEYLAKRKENLTQKSLLFTAKNNPNKQINIKDTSRAFRETARHKRISHQTNKGKTSNLTLRSLTEFYKLKTKDYRKKLRSNPAKNHEYYRKLYEAEALPNLEIEPLTTSELRETKQNLEAQIAAMQEQIDSVAHTLFEQVTLYKTLPLEDQKKFLELQQKAAKLRIKRQH